MKYFAIAILTAMCGFIPHTQASKIPDNVGTFTLDNGMKVIAITNRRIPAISHMVWYNVGAMDELPEKSGVAHYLEHLMFKKTDKLEAGDFSKTIAKHGGNDNAFTSQDQTAYFQNIAIEYLPLVMSLEANRMTNLMLTEETIITERDVVLEERSSRIDNNPGVILSEKIRATLFEKHPYGISTIGKRSEIEALTLDDTLYMYHKYYRPDNATLVVSGDIDIDTLRPLAEQYYGAITKPTTPLPKRTENLQTMPSLNKSIQVTHSDSRVRQPQWSRVYPAPSVLTGDTQHAIPLLILSQILGGSDTGRLYKTLVSEKRIATAAYCYYSEMSYGPSSFVFYAIPTQDSNFDKINTLIEQEIALILEKGITDEELSRAKNILEAESIYAQDGLQSMAYIYGRVASLGLPLEFVQQWDLLIKSTTKEDVLAAAKHVFSNQHYVTGHLVMPEISNTGVQ